MSFNRRRQWSTEQLVQNMRPFSFTEPSVLTEAEKEYLYFYDIDFYRTLHGTEQRLGYFNALGFQIALHYFAPANPRGTVLLLHGYFDHTGLYGHMIRFLLTAGFCVVCYDLPGHGLSSGKPVAIKSFADYQVVLGRCLSLVRGRVPLPLHTIGQSTGAAVLIDYFVTLRNDRRTSAFEKVILLAPLVRPVGWKKGLLIHTIVRPFLSSWRREQRENSGDRRFLRFMQEIDPLQSKYLSVDWVTSLKRWIRHVEQADPVDMDVTVIQGDSDGTVDWRHNVVVLHRKFHRAQVHYLKGAEHHLVNETKPIREKMFSIIRGVLNTP